MKSNHVIIIIATLVMAGFHELEAMDSINGIVKGSDTLYRSRYWLPEGPTNNECVAHLESLAEEEEKKQAQEQWLYENQSNLLHHFAQKEKERFEQKEESKLIRLMQLIKNKNTRIMFDIQHSFLVIPKRFYPHLFYCSIKNGHLEFAEYLLKQNKKLKDSFGDAAYKKPPIIIALKYSQQRILELLIKKYNANTEPLASYDYRRLKKI